MTKKNILFILSAFPEPIDDGIKKIVSNLIKQAISHEFSITLVVPSSQLQLSYANDIKFIFYKKSRTLLDMLKDLACGKPLYFGLYYDDSINKKIDKSEYDLIFYDFYPMTQYGSGFKNELFMMPDSMKQLAYSNFKNEKHILKKTYSFVNYLLSMRYNTHLEKFKKLYVSEEDIKLDGIKNSYFLKIPMDEVNQKKYHKIKIDKKELLFRGVMSFEPNITAVKKFYNEIFLNLLVKYPSIIFKIVGKDPSEELQNELTENTFFTGFVEDIMDEMSKSAIHVAPIYSGTGVKTKIIDSIALKRLVMTTPKGIGGIFENVKEARDNGIIIFENRDDFFRQYDDIVNDKINYDEMTKKAYNFLNKETYEKKIYELFEIAKKDIV